MVSPAGERSADRRHVKPLAEAGSPPLGTSDHRKHRFSIKVV